MTPEQEYSSVEPAMKLSEAEFDHIDNLDPQAFSELPEQARLDYFATRKFYWEGRSTMSSIEGIIIGGKTISEINAAKNQAP